MRKIVISNCTVEINLPGELDYLAGNFGDRPTVKVMAAEYLDDVAIRLPSPTGKIGQLQKHGPGGQIIMLKKVFLREILADLLPVLDENGNTVLFTNVPNQPVEPNADAFAVRLSR